MKKQPSQSRNKDSIAALFSFLLIVMGAQMIQQAFSGMYSESQWWWGLGFVIFGSMILGVAMNKICAVAYSTDKTPASSNRTRK